MTLPLSVHLNAYSVVTDLALQDRESMSEAIQKERERRRTSFEGSRRQSPC